METFFHRTDTSSSPRIHHFVKRGLAHKPVVDVCQMVKVYMMSMDVFGR
jgi:hypothetical protein